MGLHRPQPRARRHADDMAARIGADLETSRVALGYSIESVARRAGVSASTVARVVHGDAGAHLDTMCAVAAAVGLRLSLKAYPGNGPNLRDSGQLHIAQYLISQAHASLKPMLELPVGDSFGRAADLAIFSTTEIVVYEIERSVPDLQAPKRAAMLKRDALQLRHQRPVRLVLVVEDTARNRRLVDPHLPLIRADLPAGSREIMRSLRDGTDLGRDGFLWIRPWRQGATPAATDKSGG